MSILEKIPQLSPVLDQCAEVAGYLWQKGWAERNGGNMTYNLTDLIPEEFRNLPAISEPIPIGCRLPAIEGFWFYAKGTGRRMRDLARKPLENGSIIRILPGGEQYEIVADEPVMPTSEISSHLSLQNHLVASGSSYRATLHTHPIELVALSHIRHFCSSEELTRTLWSMIPETLAFAPLGLGFIPFECPGTVALAEATLREIGTYDVVLWEKHGTVAVGTDMMDAFDQTDVLNKSACIYREAALIKASLNFAARPEGMSDEQMKGIQELFKLPTERIK
ncbi:MAG: rhamnulose-1-phosphate aldolase [Bacteroidales bacterium]|nr:rhamnulose-1-phosphate aldolase [Bacteroidales bacterium]